MLITSKDKKALVSANVSYIIPMFLLVDNTNCYNFVNSVDSNLLAQPSDVQLVKSARSV